MTTCLRVTLSRSHDPPNPAELGPPEEGRQKLGRIARRDHDRIDVERPEVAHLAAR